MSLSVDDVAGACSSEARRECLEILSHIRMRDLQTVEVIGLLAILRPVHERLLARVNCSPPVALELVRSRRRKGS
jgi:hypothetical protein